MRRRVSRIAYRVSLLVAIATPLAAQSRVPVAARAIARDQVLSTEDIALRSDTSRYAIRDTRYASDTRYAQSGWVARRSIAAGEVLRQPAVAPPMLIAANQPVSVFWRDTGIEVRLKGTAMNAAPLGGRVMVHVDVRRRLEGVAVAPGLVQIK